MTGHVKITCGEHAPLDAELWIDGHKIPGLVRLSFDLSITDLPRVTITLEPETITYSGPVNVFDVQLIGHAVEIDR